MPEMSSPTPRPTPETRKISFMKGEQTFTFSWQIGKEAGVMDALLAAAQDPNNPLDWFDVAILASQLSRDLPKQIKDSLPTKRRY